MEDPNVKTKTVYYKKKVFTIKRCRFISLTACCTSTDICLANLSDKLVSSFAQQPQRRETRPAVRYDQRVSQRLSWYQKLGISDSQRLLKLKSERIQILRNLNTGWAVNNAPKHIKQF